MKFTYRTATENITIDISEEWNSILVELDHEEMLNNRKETRRHTSCSGEWAQHQTH